MSLLLQACSESGGSDTLFTNDIVQIGYSSKEDVIPASWEFSFESDEELVSLQWQFSDEGYASHSSGRRQTVAHTFTQAGIHKVRLQYETASGKTGTAENEVIIQSGVISGTIFAALNTLVDVDTRDPDEPNNSNNSFATAQPIAANTRLSGVVDIDDVYDYYQVQLQKDQSINLQVADQVGGVFATIQFQVFTSDDTNTPVFMQDLDPNTESNTGHLNIPFIVPATGGYFIKLTAISPNLDEVVVDGEVQELHSHGNYSLQIEAVSESSAFVAGELIVMMKESTGINTQTKPKSQFTTKGLKQIQGLTTRMDLGRIKTLSVTSARQFMAAKKISFSASLESNSRWQTLQIARLLAAQEDVLYAEPNWKRYPTALSPQNVADPLYSSQWHYDSINLESAWQAMDSRGSAAVTVAVLDTGVLTAHPDLHDNLVDGYDFIEGNAGANDPGDKGIGGQRSSFHGTHVAGTIAAGTNGVGGTGVAPGVKIMPVRVLGEDGGTSSQIIAGLCFAAQLNAENNPRCSNVLTVDAADIINLSLGGPDSSDIEQAVYNAVVAKGIIVIAAAGNESTSAPSYPAAYDNVISVSATNRNTELASYSNFGDRIDVAAPGGDFASDEGILSSWGDDLNVAPNDEPEFIYGSLQGTSMASPHVAGVAALMKSVNSDLTHELFRAHLIAGDLTQDIGIAGRDNKFGHGLIDAHKAVLAVTDIDTPRILTSANNLFFDVSQAARSFTLIKSGVDSDSELGAIAVAIDGADNSAGGSWLTLSKSSGLGEYIATVTRGSLAEGSYEAIITVSSDVVTVEDVVIDVVLQIGNAELSANAGVQYVLVLQEDAVANEDGVIESVTGSRALFAVDGEYKYQISGLSKGRYTVSTGSDMDFDNVICDAGESCGQYPTLSQSSTLIISEEQSSLDINMTVNYLTSSIGAASALEGQYEGELITPRLIQKPKSSVADSPFIEIPVKSKQGQ